MNRIFKALPDGRVEWQVVEEDGTLIIDGTAKTMRHAFNTSAQHCKLLDRGKHLLQHRRKT